MAFLQSKLNHFVRAVISGAFLFLGWHSAYPIALFLAFIPLLLSEEQWLKEQGTRPRLNVLFYSFIAFLIWNISTTWWIYNSTDWGSIAAWILNALFMALVFWLYHLFRLRSKHRWSVFALPVFWIGFEYLHLSWELSWPWLTLGNGLAGAYRWVQWYSMTGVLGGSFWILMVNILLSRIVIHGGAFVEMVKSKAFLIASAVFVLPIGISLFMYFNYEEQKDPLSVVVVQPNIDPYNEKFSGNTSDQLYKFLRLAEEQVDSSTDYLIGPETCIPNSIWENDLEKDANMKILKTYISIHPRLKMICGISSFRAFEPGEKRSATARKFVDADEYYDAFNTAMQLDSTKKIQLYHKSKLVPGVERMPYPRVFGFLERFAIDLGGTSGSLGTQEARTVFESPVGNAAPAICYESVYGDFLANYIRNGADFIAVITNDGWWGDTPGYRQHLMVGRLRAIENRRSIVRSANTGISCIVNQRGDILQATEYWVPDVIKGTINKNKELTYYSQTGDVIGRFFAVLAILCTLLLLLPKRLFPQ